MNRSGTRPLVTVSIPVFRSCQYLRRAVESILAQTYDNLLIVVVNDGDKDHSWQVLEHLNDDRIIRFDLPNNHGPYFVHQLTFMASTSRYFAIQDADDWSSRERLSTLLEYLARDRSRFAFSSWQQHKELSDGSMIESCHLWTRAAPSDKVAMKERHSTTPDYEFFMYDCDLTTAYINRASHHGLFERSVLEDMGGYFGGFRVNYDTLLTNLALMLGRVSFVEQPLYHYLIREKSLSHGRETGDGSPLRVQALLKQRRMYLQALESYRLFQSGRLTFKELARRVRGITSHNISDFERRELKLQATRLRSLLLPPR